MEFRSCIIDELGYPVLWCNEYTQEEIESYLQNHPEYSLSTVMINSEK